MPDLKYFNTDTNNDQWIAEQIFPLKRGGYFVEAGACDGVEGSNTLALELQLGWSGICIEASSQWFPHLQKNRRCICDNSCLSDRSCDVEYIESYGWGGVRDKLSEGKKPHWGGGAVVQKRSCTLAEVLERHAAPQTIDFLALDIEGSELAVLSAFPFDKYTVLAMSIEGTLCNEFIFSKGFIHARNPFNVKAPWENYFLHPSLFSGDALRLLGHAAAIGK